MTAQRKLIAGAVAVAVLAAAGAAFAAMRLDHAAGSYRAIVARPSLGVGGFGLGGRLGGRGLGGGVGAGGREGLGGQASRVPGFGSGLGLGRVGQSLVTTVTGYLGIDSSTLRSDLQKGQTLAQIAQAQGKTADGLVSAVVATEQASLGAAVSSGRLTSAQEQQIESRLSQLVTAIVDGTRPAGGFGRGLGPGAARPNGSPGAGSA